MKPQLEKIRLLRRPSFFSKRVQLALFAAFALHLLFFSLFRVRLPQSTAEEMAQRVAEVSVIVKKKVEPLEPRSGRPPLVPELCLGLDEPLRNHKTLPLKMTIHRPLLPPEEPDKNPETLFNLQGELVHLELEEKAFPLSTPLDFPTQVQLLVNQETGQIIWADSQELSDQTLLEIARGLRFKKSQEKGWLFGTLELLP